MVVLALAVFAAGVSAAALAGGGTSASGGTNCAPKKLLPLGKARHRLEERRCPRRKANKPGTTPTTPTNTTPASTPTTPTTTTPAPARLQVLAREYSFTLSRRSIPAGPAIVELANQGEDGHDLVVEPANDGSAAPLLTIPETPSGTHPNGKATLAPGTYRLLCDLPGHAALGMQATLEVTAP